jgi:hypothetical protein
MAAVTPFRTAATVGDIARISLFPSVTSKYLGPQVTSDRIAQTLRTFVRTPRATKFSVRTESFRTAREMAH